MDDNQKGRAYDFVISVPWAIREGKLHEILAIAAREGDGVEALRAKLGRPLDNAQNVENRDGVALIPITGPIFPRANLFTEMSGATSIEMVAQDFNTALAAPSVKAIILNIDSPGGQVNGINEFANMVYNARGVKPIGAYIRSEGASAAYWIASAADEIVADPTAILGSIGVVAVLPDPGKRAKDLTFVSANAPNKRLDPQTNAGAAAVQKEIDAIEAVFVSSVARNRGISAETVMSDFGAGGVETGQAAVDAGLADRLGSLESMIADMKKREPGMPARQPMNRGAMGAPREIDMADTQEKKSLMSRMAAALGLGEEPPAAVAIQPLAIALPSADAPPQLSASDIELAKLRAELARRDDVAATERETRITAEVDALVAKHSDKFGKEAAGLFRGQIQAAKMANDGAQVTGLDALASAMPPIGPTDRLPAGGPSADVIAAGLQPMSADAAHFEVLKRLTAAGSKVTDSDWQAKYLSMTAQVRAEGSHA